MKCFVEEHNRMTWPGLKPRPLQPESSALTIMLQHNGIFHEYKRKGEVEMQYSLSIHATEIMISFSPSVIWSCMQTLAFKCCHEKKWKNMMSSSTTIGINQCQFHVLFFFFFFQSSVALQFPEGLLLYACTIADILERYFKPIPTKLL